MCIATRATAALLDRPRAPNCRAVPCGVPRKPSAKLGKAKAQSSIEKLDLPSAGLPRPNPRPGPLLDGPPNFMPPPKVSLPPAGGAAALADGVGVGHGVGAAAAA